MKAERTRRRGGGGADEQATDDKRSRPRCGQAAWASVWDRRKATERSLPSSSLLKPPIFVSVTGDGIR